MHVLYKSSLTHNLSVERKRKIPTFTRNLPFSMTLFIFIHSYPGAVLGFFLVTELAEKMYKILHNLSVGVFQNTGGTPCPSS